MSEIKLQSEIITAFSQKYPNKRGQLFHVPNERNNKIQVFQARSIGIFPGVSDLIFIDGISIEKRNLMLEVIKNTGLTKDQSLALLNNILEVIDFSSIVLIELKEKDSRHKVQHIEQQLEWAKTMVNLGCVWRMCTNIQDAIRCTEHKYSGYTIGDVEEKLKNNGNKKTIKI